MLQRRDVQVHLRGLGVSLCKTFDRTRLIRTPLQRTASNFASEDEATIHHSRLIQTCHQNFVRWLNIVIQNEHTAKKERIALLKVCTSSGHFY